MMTPPPNSGDETPKPDDDPLGGMDPMAWLESLARRQGASPDELVTGGNLELPPEMESAPAPESASEDEMASPEVPAPEPSQTVPEPAADLTDFTGGMDPMAWLEALARRQGAPTDELVTGGTAEIEAAPAEAVGQPEAQAEPLGLEDDFDLEPLPDNLLESTSPLAWLSGLAATEAGGAPQPVGAEGGSKEDPLDGMDPMAWLEALARGEGVSEAETLPDATLETPLEAMDLEAVGAAFDAESSVEIVDGSDPMAWLAGADLGEGASTKPPQAEPEPEFTWEPEAEMQAAEPSPEVPEPAADLTDFTGGMDPMAWLEALARRQGAPTDELVTGGAAEIAEAPTEAEMAAPEPVAEAPQPEPEPEFIWEPEMETELQAAEPSPEVPEPAADLTDFTDGMDPMAWLEALARRQGAPTDELVTGGTAQIPEAPSEAEMAEPEPEFTWEPEAEMQAAEPSQEVPEPAADLTDFTGGMDPMAWLEALARRQGAPTDELVTGGTAEISGPPAPAEPGETPELIELAEANAPEPEFTWEPETEMQAAEPSQEVPEPAADLTEFTGGMDPMAWLEALARRQGAPTDELVTGGAAEIAEAPAEAEMAAPEPVAEAPGPVEILDAADPMAWLSSVTDTAGFSLDALSVPSEPEAVVPTEPQPNEPDLELAADLSAFTGGEDPLRWLESLAARQGASRDELVTSADLEIPVPAANVSVDGPGYSEFDPFSVTAPGRAPGEVPEGVTPPEALSNADALAWLESLTGASQIDLSILDAPAETTAVTDQTMTAESALSWLESLARETPSAAPSALPTQEPAPTTETTGDRMAGGLSDDVDEVRAWLEAQAHELEQTREQIEASEPYVEAQMPVLSDEPAVPGEMPDWLTTLRETTVEEIPLAESPLVEDVSLPDLPSDLPQWLAEAQPNVDLESLELEEALPQAEVSPEPESISLPTFSADELEALTRPASPDDIDSWAEALDEEYNRRQAGDESIPDWYLEAIQRAEGEWSPETAELSDRSGLPSTQAEPEAIIERAEIPDWLRASVPEAPAAVEGEDLSDVPPWLIEMSAGIDLPSVEAGPAPTEEVRPPWLPPSETREQPEAPAAEPARPAPAMAAPVPPAPAAAPRPPARTLSFARYTEVLRDARQMAAVPEQVNTALDLYQALVDDSQLLEDTRDDLQLLAKQNPGQPKVHRLLGDTFMRMGDLQSALDTYLSALDQL